jgi:hypothetical protein
MFAKAQRTKRHDEDEERPMAIPAQPGEEKRLAMPATSIAPSTLEADPHEGSTYQAHTGDVRFHVQALNGAVRVSLSNGAIGPDFAEELAAALTAAASEARLQVPPIEPPPVEPEPG